MNKNLWSTVAKQVSSGAGRGITKTASDLAKKVFTDPTDGRKIIAIQQNPHKTSSWAQLAQQGHQVVQFKDVTTGQYVGVSVDGNVTEYPK